MFNPKKFTAGNVKPLPVYLLLDVSGSMSTDGKIEALNKAVVQMIETFADEEVVDAEIHVAVITFGGKVSLHQQPTKAANIHWVNMNATGSTPMGKALEMAKSMIEDKEVTSGMAYRPVMVLVSDGMPDSGWERPLHELVSSGRSSKCDRMAMAIGRDAHKDVLNKFIEGTGRKLFFAENAKQLHEFFNLVTMSTIVRTRSKDRNQVVVDPEILMDSASVRQASQAQSDDEEGYW